MRAKIRLHKKATELNPVAADIFYTLKKLFINV